MTFWQQNWETLKRELMASVTGFHESLRSVIATSIMLVLKKGGAYVLKGFWSWHGGGVYRLIAEILVLRCKR